MNKYYLLFAVIIVLFSSCKPEEPDYKEEIKGKWICQDIDNVTIPTNEVFAISFNNDGSETYAQGYKKPNGSLWVEGADYTYTVTDNIINITGKNPLNESVEISLSITRLTSNSLIYKETKNIVNGIEYAPNREFSLYRNRGTYDKIITGTWVAGKVAPKETEPDIDQMFVFKEDNSFDCYEKSGEEWTAVPGVKGEYFLNEDILAFNYVINNGQGIEIIKYECWILRDYKDKELDCWQWNRTSQNGDGLTGTHYKMRKLN